MNLIPFKTLKIAFFILGSIGLLTLTDVHTVSADSKEPLNPHTAVHESKAPLESSAVIIADHTVVDQYDQIPQVWIDEVKKMRLNIPGESHSEAYRAGMQLLMDLDPDYPASITETGSPEPYREDALRVDRLVRNQYGSWVTWLGGEEDWYTGYVNSDGSVNEGGIQPLKDHLTYSNTNNLEIAAMGFGWCWDMTWHNGVGGGIDPVYQVCWAGSSVGGPNGDLRWGLDADDYSLTSNRVCMDTYLSATQSYSAHCQSNGYSTVVLYTTGPVDGGGNTGESGYQRYLKHQHIREYVQTNGGVLFDYADILCWGNDGTQQTTSWTDHGGTVQTFQHIHGDNMLALDGTYDGDTGHIGERGAVRLAKAMWWLLARLAGWDGVPEHEGKVPIGAFHLLLF